MASERCGQHLESSGDVRLTEVQSVSEPAATQAWQREAERLSAVFAQSAEDHDRSGSFPVANLEALRQAGLLALTVPRALGGGGAGLACSAGVVAAIARGEPATALILAMQLMQHALLARIQNWPPSVYHRVARSAVQDGALINALRVEPDLGTPARGGLPATLARRTERGWSLTGHKIFATGAPVLTWMLVWARTEDDPPLTGNFLIPAHADGVSIVKTWDHLGMRATESHDVVLRDVSIPHDYAIDLRAEWPVADATQAAWNAVVIGSLYQGIASAARDWLVGWLHARKPSNLGASLATLPRMQTEVGAIDGLLGSAQRLLRSVAAAADGNLPDAPTAAEAGLLKRMATANAIEAVQLALAVTGNAGLSRKNPLERHLRDVLCGRVHTPQDDAALLAAGRAALLEHG
jgi:alkylation response protein AidB-like acyl-CoA dehydrogenase